MNHPSTSQALQIPPGEFHAYLFDLDGTVADSMPLHYRSWAEAVTEHGGSFPMEDFYNWAGVPLPRTVEMLNEKYRHAMDPRAVVDRKEALYLQLLSELRPVPSVLQIIESNHGKLPFAIVSGSPTASIHRTLQRLGIERMFSVIVGPDDYTHGKPDPEPFLIAAHRLGVATGRCLVFEDGDAGIAAARAAGMAWVRIPVTRIKP